MSFVKNVLQIICNDTEIIMYITDNQFVIINIYICVIILFPTLNFIVII